MPRRIRSLPPYRKHRPSGQAVVTLNGHDCYLGPHGSDASRVQYDRLIAEWLANNRRPVATPGTAAASPTVNALILAYWKHVEVYYVKAGKPTSEQSNIRQALRWLRRLYGTTSAAEFRPLALKAVRQTMIDAGHARTTINKNIARIRQVFRWAVANELVPAEVDHGLRTVEGLKRGRCGVRETEPVRPVADELVEHSLRWDVLPVRIAGAKQHAKISLPPILHAKAGPGPLERDGSCPPNRFEPAA